MAKRKNNTPIYIGKDFWETGLEPPASSDLEEMVIGAIILEYTAMQTVEDSFKPHLFFYKPYRIVATVIWDMWQAKKAIDSITVMDELKRRDLLNKDDVNIPFIASLTNRIASTAHLEYHIRVLSELYLKRSLTQLSATTMQRIHTNNEDVFEVHADFMVKADNLLNDVIQIEADSIGEVNKRLAKAQLEASRSEELSGVPTGLARLDRVTNGWQDSDLIIIAGRPSMGKTAFVLSCTLHPAVRLDIPIGIFSLEMSTEQLVGRAQAQFSGIDVGRIIKKQLREEEVEINTARSEPLNKAPIYIDDTPSISVIELKAKARRLVREKGVKLIIIDYLQLMKSGLNITNRVEEISVISRELKAIAKELNIPVIALSQLSRAVETRGGDKKPMLSDLRESGQIEQDADLVAFCYRPEYYGINEYYLNNDHYDGEGLFMLLIAKHRNGSLGEIPLSFQKQLARIRDHHTDNPAINDTFVQLSSNESGALKPNSDFDISTSYSQSTEDDREDWLKKADDEDIPF